MLFCVDYISNCLFYPDFTRRHLELIFMLVVQAFLDFQNNAFRNVATGLLLHSDFIACYKSAI